MASLIRFCMIGGFLGAGKTTTISRLARNYQAQGLRVCIVTNDQGADLVDTQLLRSQGFTVGEVAGSCFCCNFDGLTSAMEAFERSGRPDVILAEPVGSCTDLVATVAMPMMHMLGERFEIAPYAVIVKPSHGLRILGGERSARSGFSPQAEYIFRKQLEEAELLLINRIDELSPEQRETLESLLADQYPRRQTLCISARTGAGLDELAARLMAATASPRATMDLDYDIYAAGEADLGWLNATVRCRAAEAQSLDRLVRHLVDALRRALDQRDVETAHLKAIAMAGGGVSVANLISRDSDAVLSESCERSATDIELIINARVATAPAQLEDVVRRGVTQAAADLDLSADVISLQCFRPGRPVPTHRVVVNE